MNSGVLRRHSCDSKQTRREADADKVRPLQGPAGPVAANLAARAIGTVGENVIYGLRNPEEGVADERHG